MGHVIYDLPVADIDRLEGLWRELLDHHLAAGSWQWGDQVGALETLVVASSARGTGVGRELLGAARARLAAWGTQVMTISVVAGNEGAMRFYQREGARDYLRTLIMPAAE